MHTRWGIVVLTSLAWSLGCDSTLRGSSGDAKTDRKALLDGASDRAAGRDGPVADRPAGPRDAGRWEGLGGDTRRADTIISDRRADAGHAQAATTCLRDDVAKAVAAAAPGDTVLVPPGTCPWSSGLVVDKPLTIRGAGAGQTNISYAQTGPDSEPLFVTTGQAANGLRITALELRSCVQCFYFDGSGSPKQALQGFRIDHCTFKNANIVLETDGASRGVVDSCLFQDSYGARIYGSNDPAAAFPFVLGTDQAVFFEDNSITVSPGHSGQGLSHFIASNSGSRYVVRHNTFAYQTSLWNIVDAHGYCEVAGRGSFTWEIYDNVFNLVAGLDSVIRLRGGQGTVFNNTFSNAAQWAIVLTDYMTCSPPCVATCAGYPCQDQINHAYFWNNKAQGVAVVPTNDCTGVIQLGRDYFNSQPAGYQPFTYPHPLRSTP